VRIYERIIDVMRNVQKEEIVTNAEEGIGDGEEKQVPRFRSEC
jgi:hypothetical protein